MTVSQTNTYYNHHLQCLLSLRCRIPASILDPLLFNSSFSYNQSGFCHLEGDFAVRAVLKKLHLENPEVNNRLNIYEFERT